MKFYSYYRSSAAYRVRIALNLKQLPHETAFVHLVNRGGEHRLPEYAALNPQKLVPALEHDGRIFTQSLAIIEYLDEIRAEPPLLPATAAERAHVRAIAQLIACDTHPLNNLRVLKYLEQQFGADQTVKTEWYRHWIHESFAALETLLAAPETGRFCHGDAPTLADCCLVPQVYNARRFGVDVSAYPIIERIDATCRGLPAFQQADPKVQPDAE